jgi:16S rRNA (cytidine1402-2'-O)-methyltransferase
MRASLFLIPVTLGDTEHRRVLPEYNRDVILSIRHFIVENVRTARRFLKKVEPGIVIDDLTFYELNKHTVSGDYNLVSVDEVMKLAFAKAGNEVSR